MKRLSKAKIVALALVALLSMGLDPWDTANPTNSSVVSAFPANERAHRLNLEAHWNAEHSETTGFHLFGVGNDAARDAAITSPAAGNFWLHPGSAPASDAPRIAAVSFYDGTTWIKGHFVPTGTVLMAAYDVSSPPDGYLPCDGAAVSRTTYADLFAVIGTAFDQQDGVAAPAGTDFRVPLISGSGVIGLSGGAKSQLGWVRNVSGLKDVFVTGTYTGSSRAIFIVEITASGTPDTFRWSDDGGATYTTGVSVAATNVLGATGLTLNWQATTGHADGDVWMFIGDPLMDSIGATIGVDAWQLVEAESAALTHIHDHFIVNTDDVQSGLAAGETVAEEDTSGSDANQRYDLSGTSTPATLGLSSEDTFNFGGDQAHETAPHAVVLGHLIKL